MTKPNWTPTLEQVLGHKTERVTKVSARTNNEYQAEVIPTLGTRLISIDEVDGGYKYSIIDEKTNLEFTIKVLGQKIDVPRFGRITFFQVTGGPLNNGGAWYKAENAQLVKEKED